MCFPFSVLSRRLIKIFLDGEINGRKIYLQPINLQFANGNFTRVSGEDFSILQFPTPVSLWKTQTIHICKLQVNAIFGPLSLSNPYKTLSKYNIEQICLKYEIQRKQ